jgi:hypothetical protein
VVARPVIANLFTVRTEVVAEVDGWSAFIPGLPIAADGDRFDAAIMELLDALREYAQDWTDHLSAAPNHRGNRQLVELVHGCDDDQLRDWLVARH